VSKASRQSPKPPITCSIYTAYITYIAYITISIIIQKEEVENKMI